MVARPGWLQLFSRAVHTDTEQVEIGAHRGLQVDDTDDTADFDLPYPLPTTTTNPVASII